MTGGDKSPTFEIEVKSQCTETEKPLDQDEPWKPNKIVLVFCVVAFLAVSVVDKIIFDFADKLKSRFLIAIVYFFDACGRLLICSFLINWNTLFQKVNMKAILWVSFCRFGLQIGFLMGTISIKYIGGGTLSMMIQTQLLITGAFRYLIFKEKLSHNQILFAIATALGAFAFKIDNIDNPSEKFGYSMGMMICGISCIIVSLFFVLTEMLLKEILKPFQGWDKQFFIAMVDIPIMIVVSYLNVCWDIYGQKQDRSVNIFEGIDGLCIGAALNCVAFGILLYFLFDWIDSIIVNVLFVISMALTWPLEIAFGFEKYFSSRFLILIFTVICCIGYQNETVKRVKRKKLKESLESKAID